VIHKGIKFHVGLTIIMAEETFMFAVTAGVFVFLVAVLFGSRARRYSQGYTPSEAHSEHG
jgi:heme/copper-type cytochrome/quinol oxidase subunit 2